MVIKVGLNGFGRIGKVVFRTCLQNPDLEISAINDPAINADYISYLIKFDSTHGKLTASISHTENTVTINGKTIQVFHEKQPTEIPWKTVGIQYVVEASGMFTTYDKAAGHLKNDSVKRVIVTAPSLDIPMTIFGVNHSKLGADQRVLSCGSSTLYCLAPIIKVLEDNFGVEEGFITSIHAMTPSLKPLDGLCLRGKHWRDHRSIHQNIIPASTGACKALGRIIPSMRDKMTGLAFRVPIVNVSVLDISVRLVKPTSIQEIIKSIRTASKGSLRNIIKLSTEEAVSSDFNRDSHSCIVDGELSLSLNQNSFKIICWYENEYSYACRVLDSIFFSEKQLSQEVSLSTLICATTTPLKLDLFIQTQNTKRTEKTQDETKMSVETANVTKMSRHHSRSLRSMFMRQSPICTTSPTKTAAKKESKTLKIIKAEMGLPMFPRREYKGSLFQSFNTKTTQEFVQSDCAKAQERLEKVKVEFCKMVNITEDLLKKSYKQNNETQSSSITFNHQQKDPNENFEEAFKVGSSEKHSKLEENSFQTDKVNIIKGVKQINISTTTSTVDSFTLINDEHRCSIPNNNNNLTFAPSLHKFPSIKNITTTDIKKTSSDKNHRVNKLDAIVESSNVSNFHEYDSTVTVSSVREHFLDKSPLRSQAGTDNYICTALSKAQNYKNKKVNQPASKQANSDSRETEIQKYGNALLKLSEKEISKISLSFFQNKSSLNAIEKELRKRNIVLISDEAKKKEPKDNKSKIKENRNLAGDCCPRSTFTFSGGSKKHISLTYDSANKRCSSLREKFESDIKKNVIEKEITNKAPDTDIKTDNKLSVKNDQKDSDYETDNISAKTDMEKENNFEDYSSGSNVFILKTENDCRNVNNILNDNSLHVNKTAEIKKSNLKRSNEVILLHDDYNNNDTDGNSQSNMGELSNEGSPGLFLPKELNSTDKKMSLDCSGYSQEYSMTRAKDMTRPEACLRAEESHPSMSSGNSNPPTRPDSERPKRDIYEKLDSVSASDSDGSSHIDGRKSQVINITDLTNSLEDLERLDKICRIVEISDELSNKLFSSLDSGDSQAKFTTKKWSFKDLCEKINLDEFCNKLFGQLET